jgi:hypothetical protein
LFIQSGDDWKIIRVAEINGKACMNHIKVEFFPKEEKTLAISEFSLPINKAEIESINVGTHTISVLIPIIDDAIHRKTTATTARRAQIALYLVKLYNNVKI